MKTGIVTSEDISRLLDRMAALQDQNRELLEALEAITGIAGNLPDDRITTRTGPNDAVARGLMVAEARRIARAAIAKAKGEA